MKVKEIVVFRSYQVKKMTKISLSLKEMSYKKSTSLYLV